MDPAGPVANTPATGPVSFNPNTKEKAMSQRHTLWRELRAAVRAGDTEGAHKIAQRLGWHDRAARGRLIEKIWDHVKREVPA